MINLYGHSQYQSGWEIAGMIFAILLFIVLALLFPLAVIWALNTLFTALMIPYNIWSWLAVVVLGLFNRQIIYKKN